MKIIINFSEFCDYFTRMGRDNNFSYDGKRALFEHLTFLEEVSGIEIELDIIALCCEYVEFEDIAEFHESYDREEYPGIEDIKEATKYIDIEGSDGFIVSNF